MLEISPDIYRVVFLSEDTNGGGRWPALPTRRYEEDYDERLKKFVRENYPDLITFAERHNAELDFESSAGTTSSSVLLRIRDEETLALLRLGFESNICKIQNFADYLVEKRDQHALKVLERQKEEFEHVKARYFELKAILEPD